MFLHIHGTGVRENEAYAKDICTIQEKIQKYDLGLSYKPCYWGFLWDKQEKITSGKPSRSLKRSNDLSPEEMNTLRWFLLELDPLLEIRMLKMKSQGSNPSSNTAGEVIERSLQNFLLLTKSPSPDLQQLLEDIGISDSCESIIKNLTHSSVVEEMLKNAYSRDSLHEYYEAISRAIIASAVEMNREKGLEINFSSQTYTKKKELLQALVEELSGGAELAMARQFMQSVLDFCLSQNLCKKLLDRVKKYKLGEAINFPKISDILLYLTHDQLALQYIKGYIDPVGSDKSILLVAHSLGGIACVDLLAKNPELCKKVKLLVTVGSQSPFLYKKGILPSSHDFVDLHQDFPNWLNIYHASDWLGFSNAGELSSRAKDKEIGGIENPFFDAHEYWSKDETWSLIKTAWEDFEKV
jgi:hypothetical protein